MLRGEGGNDKLTGGAGRDTQIGGAGNDMFFYGVRTHSDPGATADRILDFDDAGNDRINLSAVYSGKLA